MDQRPDEGRLVRMTLQHEDGAERERLGIAVEPLMVSWQDSPR
jgi:hypothetical protein